MGESKALSFDATFTNMLNQQLWLRSYGSISTHDYTVNYLTPPTATWPRQRPRLSTRRRIEQSLRLRSGYEQLHGNNADSDTMRGPITINSQYGKPLRVPALPGTSVWQLHFTF